MNSANHSLLEFLTITQCRMQEHYQEKLLECLTVLNEYQLWHTIDGTTGHTIGGLIRHILEHPRRHVEWMRTGRKPQNEPRIQDFFPSTCESPSEMLDCVDEIFNAWNVEMLGLIQEVLTGGSLPITGPNMSAIYHLVEHVSYHLGQVIAAAEMLTGHTFNFCQRGINEASLNQSIEALFEPEHG